MMKVLKSLITLLLVLLFCYFVQKEISKFPQAKMRALNYLRPFELDYLARIKYSSQEFDPNRLKEMLNYYQKVSEYVPSQVESLGLSGFCLYYLGNKKESVEYYQKASVAWSDFFYFHYNLGIIYLKMRDKDKARESLEKALRCRPEYISKIIQNSPRFYIPNVSYMTSSAKINLQSEIRSGYERAAYLLSALKSGKVLSEAFLRNLELEIY